MRMETINVIQTKPFSGKGARWTGRILSTILVLFLFVDAIMKVVKATPSMEGSVQLGWPQSEVQSIGIALLVSTLLYIIPRMSLVGAILLTGYLGGATSIMVRAMQPGHPYLFPVI